jgi:uncharacterized protein (TIGR03790 family)
VRRAVALSLLLLAARAGADAQGGAAAAQRAEGERSPGAPPDRAAPLQTGAPEPEAHPEVLIVVNGASPVSKGIGEAYRRARGVPEANVCALDVPLEDPLLVRGRHESVTAEQFEARVRAPLARCLEERGLVDQIEIIVTTKGVPLSVGRPIPDPRNLLRDSGIASVEAELALLFSDRIGAPGVVRTPNPYFGSRTPFRTWKGRGKPLRYLVARLDAYSDVPGTPDAIPRDVRALIERGQAAGPGGSPFAIDEDPKLRIGRDAGNVLLLAPAAAALRALGLPVLHETTPAPIVGAENLAGLASWGSNASNAERDPGPPYFGTIGGRLLPGRFAARSIAVPLVSTDARSFLPGTAYGQSLTADLLRLGAGGAAGHVAEPTLSGVARPYLLLREWALGATAVEAFYRSIPYLGWTNVYVGDPLMTFPDPRPRAEDQDGDGVPDARDVCRDLPNPDQRDTDGDGFGNLCDADVDNNGWVTSSWGLVQKPGDLEQIALSARAFERVPDRDLNGDGKVDLRDVGLAQVMLFQRPGPGAKKGTSASSAPSP